MKVVRKATMLLIFVAALPVLAAIQRITPVADDPYAPLKVYDGKWDSTTTIGPKRSSAMRTIAPGLGSFFVCEQAVNGKTEALTVFLPVAKMVSGGEEHRVNGLSADASPAGGWNKLTIEGDRWVYSWEDTDSGKKVSWATSTSFPARTKSNLSFSARRWSYLENCKRRRRDARAIRGDAV